MTSQNRICVPTLRRIDRRAFRGIANEAEDVLASVDDVDLIELEPGHGYESRKKLSQRLYWNDPSGLSSSLNPGLRKVRLAHDYDLLVLYCAHFEDLLCVNAIENMKEACATTVCVVDELWANEASDIPSFLKCLDRFDHLIVAFKGTIEPLSRILGRPVHFVPPAVDAVRFSPVPDWPDRVIDIYSMGRRYEPLHKALRRYCDKDRFYIYESLEGGVNLMRDSREHRELYANLTKRSVGFMVAPAKVDSTEETRGQIEIPNRFYEGISAGAILLGQKPRCDYFDELFDWEEAVVELDPEGADLALVLDSLFADDDRREKISRENVRQALLRHDWAYRWQSVLKIAGLEPLAAMQERLERLRGLAAQVG